MAFFELPRRRTPQVRPEGNPDSDFWTASPRGFLPAVVPIEILAHHADLAAIYVSHASVFSDGCSLWLTAFARLHSSDPTRERMVSDAIFADSTELRQLTELDDALVRFGVSYSDGSRATTLDDPIGETRSDAAATTRWPILLHYEHNANVGDLHWQGQHELWLSPLPPAEPFELVLEWPRLEVPLTRVIIDGRLLTRAAERSRRIWPST